MEVRVPTTCSITMLCNPAGMWQQEHLTMTKHVHRASNLANEDVDLVGKHGAVSVVVQCA